MPKKCSHPPCKRNQWGGGYCDYHQYMREKKDKKYPNPRGLYVRPQETEEDQAEELLNAWFKEREQDIIDSGSRCFECGALITEEISRYTENKIVQVGNYRNVTAHIVPKSLFPSVATHPLNFIVLGAACGCHGKYDSSIDKAKLMRVWPEAVERFLQFVHLIKEKHKFLTAFKEAINKL